MSPATNTKAFVLIQRAAVHSFGNGSLRICPHMNSVLFSQTNQRTHSKRVCFLVACKGQRVWGGLEWGRMTLFVPLAAAGENHASNTHPPWALRGGGMVGRVAGQAGGLGWAGWLGWWTRLGCWSVAGWLCWCWVAWWCCWVVLVVTVGGSGVMVVLGGYGAKKRCDQVAPPPPQHTDPHPCAHHPQKQGGLVDKS